MSHLTDIMKARHNIGWFSDEVPDKKLIDDILIKAHYLVPHKNNFWYYRVKVLGPEHKEEKKKLAVASVCGSGKEQFRNGTEADIERLYKLYDEFMSDENRKKGYKNIENCGFNTQVLAPYLLVYTHQKDYRTKIQNESEYNKSGRLEKHFARKFNKIDNFDWVIQASMHGISVSYLCAENYLYASFCRCYFFSKHINSKIFKSKDDIDNTAFLLGLGHRDKNKSYWTSNVTKPSYNEIVEWK